MASIVTSAASCIVSAVAFCFCQACSSLLCACCGNEKDASVPPSATSGRKRSVGLLLLAVILGIAFQFGIAPAIVDNKNPLSTFIRNAWNSGCEQYSNNADLRHACAGNSGNYRAFASAFVFFVLAAVAVCLKRTANREAWPAKYVLFLFLVGITVFIPNEPLFNKIFLNVARVGAGLFIVFQQFVIVDMAHSWNENWVEKHNQAELEQHGSGRKWLRSILIACAIMFSLSTAGIVYMLVDFTGCPTNNAFIAITIIMIVLTTGAQLSGEEGSLLSSTAVAAWATLLCYNAVSKNPDRSCNPLLGKNDALNIAVGLAMTLLSMGWTGWSWTAEDKLVARSNGTSNVEAEKPEEKKVGGIVTSGYGTHDDVEGGKEDDHAAETEADNDAADPAKLSNSWRLNVILVFITCWTSMVLTGWGDISSHGQVANPSAGRIGMWMVIASQWLALFLYLWTLVAPRLFPDRDFS